MPTYRITAIRKPDVNSKVEHITHVLAPGFSPYPITVESVISLIRNGNEFFVGEGLWSAKVEVVQWGLLSRPYIRTVADQTKVDNLLSLPQC